MGALLAKPYHIPAKGVERRIICHFSDVHLTAYDEQSDEEEKRIAVQKTEDWAKGRLHFAQFYQEPCGEEQMADSRLQFIRLLEAANETDAAVITGDVMDYVSGGNLRAVEQGLCTLSVPYVMVCGNHDRAQDIPDGLNLSVIKQPVSVMNLGDLQIVGIDDSDRCITAAQLATLEKLLDTGKKTIIAMHIPIMTEGNRNILMRCGEYFRLNEYDGCPQENEAFLSLITREDSPVVAVLTGHLHFGNVSEISHGRYQYGVSQGITGSMHLYTIGE